MNIHRSHDVPSAKSVSWATWKFARQNSINISYVFAIATTEMHFVIGIKVSRQRRASATEHATEKNRCTQTKSEQFCFFFFVFLLFSVCVDSTPSAMWTKRKTENSTIFALITERTASRLDARSNGMSRVVNGKCKCRVFVRLWRLLIALNERKNTFYARRTYVRFAFDACKNQVFFCRFFFYSQCVRLGCRE